MYIQTYTFYDRRPLRPGVYHFDFCCHCSGLMQFVLNFYVFHFSFSYMYATISTFDPLIAVPLCCDFPTCRSNAIPVHSFVLYIINKSIMPL